jgi:hypothetical protein
MRVFTVCALLVASATPLPATLIHTWSVSEIENASAMVVATVESVTQKEMVPASERLPNSPAQYWEASLRVLRAYPAGAVAGKASITVRYAAGDRSSGGGFGNSVSIWPHFEQGVTALIPLTPDNGSIWRLVATQGGNLTVPAIEQAPQTAGTLSTGRAFILAELANTLANGATAKRSDAAVYLRNGFEWPDGLREALERAVGNDDDRWLEVAGTVLANRGIPHSHIDQLMANENLTAKADQAAAWVLAAGVKRDYPERLIWTLRNMADYD